MGADIFSAAHIVLNLVKKALTVEVILIQA
jgi:hypothetical protein